jgi:hypothetical protein
MAKKNSFKYSDEEIITLVKLNPGYGIRRFVDMLYPNSKQNREYRFMITMLLNDYLNESGIDLYELLQSSDYSTLVTRNEYIKITGRKHVPNGLGQSKGGRTSALKRKGQNLLKEIRLPPQEFDWGGIESGEIRNHRSVKREE